MNGWQRLFAVAAVLVVVPVALVDLWGRPESPYADGISEVYCRDMIPPFTTESAAGHLEYIHSPQGQAAGGVSQECAGRLEYVASGKAEADQWASWRSRTRDDLWVTACCLAIVYALGLAVAWIRAGFRKPN